MFHPHLFSGDDAVRHVWIISEVRETARHRQIPLNLVPSTPRSVSRLMRYSIRGDRISEVVESKRLELREEIVVLFLGSLHEFPLVLPIIDDLFALLDEARRLVVRIVRTPRTSKTE